MRSKIVFRHKDSNIELSLQDLVQYLNEGKKTITVQRKPPKHWKLSDNTELIGTLEQINYIPFSDEWDCIVK